MELQPMRAFCKALVLFGLGPLLLFLSILPSQPQAQVTAPEKGTRAGNTNGAQIFKSSRCFACHGQMGAGGMGPALAGDPMLAVQQFVVAQILIGRGAMPAFADKLSNEEIAAVATYIRNSWGNDFGPVIASDVEGTRQLMKHAKQVSAKVSSPQ